MWKNGAGIRADNLKNMSLHPNHYQDQQKSKTSSS